MMLQLKRVSIIDSGAFGVLCRDNAPFAVTVERTYINQSVKIPPGPYTLVRAHYNRGGYDVWQITGGPVGRERLIYIHKGNVEDDVDGCIAIGEQFGVMKGKPAVLQSGAAFDELMRMTAMEDRIPMMVSNA